jgi:hypothetical protein
MLIQYLYDTNESTIKKQKSISGGVQRVRPYP